MKDLDPITCVLCLFREIPSATKQAGISHVYLLRCFSGFFLMMTEIYAGVITSLLIPMSRFPWHETGALPNDQSAWDQDPWIIIAVPLQVFDQ